MSQFQIQKATREGVKPLIVPYSESGCGKTMSSLLLARGLAGPDGKIVLADSESRRGSLYADVIPGGFETFDLCPPFSPARYIEAIDAIEASGAAVGVLDSGSHEWDGPGSVNDLAAQNEERSGKPGLHNWRGPKMEHAKFVQRLLRTKIPFIICLRAKFKTRQGKDERGKTAIIKDDHVSPIQAEDFIFEATAHFEILPDHSIRLTKVSHPTLGACFPQSGPITIQHGELLARWCTTPGKPVAPSDPLGQLKLRLWRALEPVRGKDKWGASEAEAWLRSKKILPADVTIAQLTADDFQIVIDKTEIEMEQAK